MSLIAVTINQDKVEEHLSPIMIGDLLISTNRGRPNISLPTFVDGAKNFYDTHSPYLPIGLSQKIYVISDNLAIGLSGLGYEIKAVLENIKDYFRFRIATDSLIKTWFENEVKSLNLTECTFGILLVENEKVEFYRIGNSKWIEESNPVFGRISACASGKEDFINFTKMHHPPSQISSGNFLKDIIAKHLVFFGQLITVEKLQQKTIKKFWGINYELIMFSDGKFQKLNNVTHFIIKLHYDLSSGKMYCRPLHIYNSQYFKDILLVQTIDFIPVERFAGYAIAPIDKSIVDRERYNLPKPEFEAVNICLSSIIAFSDGTISINHLCTDAKDEKEKDNLKISYTNGNLSYYISQSIFDSIKHYALTWKNNN